MSNEWKITIGPGHRDTQVYYKDEKLTNVSNVEINHDANAELPLPKGKIEILSVNAEIEANEPNVDFIIIDGKNKQKYRVVEIVGKTEQTFDRKLKREIKDLKEDIDEIPKVYKTNKEQGALAETQALHHLYGLERALELWMYCMKGE